MKYYTYILSAFLSYSTSVTQVFSQATGNSIGRATYLCSVDVIVHVVQQHENGVIEKLKRSSGESQQLVTFSGERSGVSSSADGAFLTYSGRDKQGGNSAIYLFDLAAGQERTIFTDSGACWAPVFSKDGTRVYFARGAFRPSRFGGMVADHADIWVIDVSGGQPIQVTNEQFRRIVSIDVSTDGSWLVFGANRSRENTAVFIARQGQNAPFWSSSKIDMTSKSESVPIISSFPRITPDGGRIIFLSTIVSRNSPYDYEIWSMQINGDDLTQHTTLQQLICWPTVSPDGKKVLFSVEPRRVPATRTLWELDLPSGTVVAIR